MADVKICDRCGQVFGRSGKWINVRPERYILSFISRRIDCYEDEYLHTDEYYDLCLSCRKELEKFLRGRPLMGEEKE